MCDEEESNDAAQSQKTDVASMDVEILQTAEETTVPADDSKAKDFLSMKGSSTSTEGTAVVLPAVGSPDAPSQKAEEAIDKTLPAVEAKVEAKAKTSLMTTGKDDDNDSPSKASSTPMVFSPKERVAKEVLSSSSVPSAADMLAEVLSSSSTTLSSLPSSS